MEFLFKHDSNVTKRKKIFILTLEQIYIEQEGQSSMYNKLFDLEAELTEVNQTANKTKKTILKLKMNFFYFLF